MPTKRRAPRRVKSIGDRLGETVPESDSVDGSDYEHASPRPRDYPTTIAELLSADMRLSELLIAYADAYAMQEFAADRLDRERWKLISRDPDAAPETRLRALVNLTTAHESEAWREARVAVRVAEMRLQIAMRKCEKC